MRSFSVLMTLMLVFSSTVWAAEPMFTGSLRSSGPVLSNSVPIPDSGTVLSGDRLETGPIALAVISSPSYGRLELR